MTQSGHGRGFPGKGLSRYDAAMRRREFIGLLGGAAAAWPFAAPAQPTKLPTIGFLGGGTSSAFTPWTAAFVQRLRELGWIEGRTVAIEYRWAEGRKETVWRNRSRIRSPQSGCHRYGGKWGSRDD